MGLQNLVQQIDDTIQGKINGVHTVIPGTIQSFDPGSCTASVKPVMQFVKPDRTKIDYPEISGVPVLFPQAYGQKATVAFPIKPGDGCLILVAEQSIDYWQYGNETETDLRYDLTNALCIVGLFRQGNPVEAEATSGNKMILDLNGSRIEIKGDEVTINRKTTVGGNIIINGNATVNGNIVASGSVTCSEVITG